MNVSDRIAVMHEGEITGVLDREDCNEQTECMQLAVGKKIPRRKLHLQVKNRLLLLISEKDFVFKK